VRWDSRTRASSSVPVSCLAAEAVAAAGRDGLTGRTLRSGPSGGSAGGQASPGDPLGINWSSRAGGRLAPGVRGGGVGRRPGSGQWGLVRGRRVDGAAAAQERRERGDRGQGAVRVGLGLVWGGRPTAGR
jgi:hypothetical protein